MTDMQRKSLSRAAPPRAGGYVIPRAIATHFWDAVRRDQRLKAQIEAGEIEVRIV